jgi:hypothetical protein
LVGCAGEEVCMERHGPQGPHRRKLVRRAGRCLAAAAVAAGAWTAIGPAGAATATVSDPLGDNGPGLDPRGDVVEVKVTNASALVVLEATTAVFEDPVASRNWLNGVTGVVFEVETTADTQPDFYVNVFNSGFGPYGVVVALPSNTLVCAADPSWDAGARTYAANVDPSCFGNASSLAAAASFQYFDEQFRASYDSTALTPRAGLDPPPTTVPPTTTVAPTTTTVASTTTTVAPPPTTVAPTTTTLAPTPTPDPVDCKYGWGWGDRNHVRCPRDAVAKRR